MEKKPQHFYGAVHKDITVCKNSSSGGAFTAITDCWFQKYSEMAVVYGCAIGSDLIPKHVRADDFTKRDSMRGSKYVGSDMSGTMRQAEKDLRAKKYVLFSGTPCQIAGLKSFLKIKGIDPGDHLLTVDLVCHGVGSLRYFKDYLAAYERKFRSKVVKCSFRGKRRPGKKTQMVLWFENGQIYESPAARYDEFLAVYGSNHILRPSCFNCPYSSMKRESDITIGDSWSHNEKNQKDLSLIITNTDVGEFWLRKTLNSMDYVKLTEGDAIQPNLKAPSKKPKNYVEFWTKYRKDGYQSAQRFLGRTGLKQFVLKHVLRILYILHFEEILKK